MMDELLRLIFGAILLIFIFSFFGKFAYNFFVAKSIEPSLKSFDALVEEIQALEDQENKTVPVFTKLDGSKGMVIIGFEENQETVKGKCYERSSGKTLLEIEGELYKPMSACGSGGCLCLYSVVYDNEKIKVSNLEIIKCQAVDYSIKGGESTFIGDPSKKPPEWLVNIFGASIIYGLEPDENIIQEVVSKPREITCEYAVIPSFGDLAMIGIQRQQETVYICMGGDCHETVSCGTLDEFHCAVYKGVCYPRYDRDDVFKSCEYCPESGFECDSFYESNVCGPVNCKTACNRNHCHTGCVWIYRNIDIGKCVDESTLEPWEEIDDWRQCYKDGYFPSFDDMEFDECIECPASFKCSDLDCTKTPNCEEMCDNFICSKACEYVDSRCQSV